MKGKGRKQDWRFLSNNKYCSRIKLKRLSILLSTTIILSMISIGLSYLFLGMHAKSILLLLSDYLRPWGFDLLSHASIENTECSKISSIDYSFNDSETLVTYAATDPDEFKFGIEFGKLMDDNPNHITSSFSALLRNPRFSAFKSKFHQILINWAKQKQYQSQVMQELLEMVKKPMDKYYEALNHSNIELGGRYKTCAVVGNSGIIINSSYGDFIDSHDMVIRLNNAKVSQLSFKKFLGSKTTLMFMNSHILHQCAMQVECLCHPYGVQVPIMLYLCNLEHALDVALCGSKHKAPLFITDARFNMLVARISRWYSLNRFFENTKGATLDQWENVHKHEFHYSSGMQAVMLSLSICDKVNIFGFGKNIKSKHHFHTTQKFEHYAHDYEAEYLFYNDLQARRIAWNPFLCSMGIKIPPLEVFL